MENEIKTKINEFIKKHGDKIPSELMPQIKIHWNKGLNYAILNEGIGFTRGIQEDGRLCVKPANTKVYYSYIEYDKDIDVLALSIAKINTSRVAPYVREWQPLDGICYMVNHQKVFYDRNGEPEKYLRAADSRYEWNVEPKEYFRQLYSYIYYYDENKETIAKEFLGETFNEAGIRCQPTRFYHFLDWFKRKDKPCAKLKKKDAALIQTELPELEIKDEWIHNRNKWTVFFPVRITTTEAHDIIRIYDNNKKEYLRIFVNDKEIISFLKNRDNKWEKKPMSADDGWLVRYIVPIIEEIDNSKYIKYIKNLILKEAGDNWKALNLTRVSKIIKLPIIEQLYKAGYVSITENVDKFAKADLTSMFGHIDLKAKGIYKQLGVNKYQLEDFEKIRKQRKNGCSSGYYSPAYVKEFLSINDISFLDDGTYNTITKYIAQTHFNRISTWEYCHYTYIDLLDYIGITDAEQKYIMCKRFYKIWQEHTNVYTVFIDSINNYRYLRDRRITIIDINWRALKEYNDFVRIHDYLMNIANRTRMEEQARWKESIREEKKKNLEKYLKTLKENKEKYNFEDEDFLIKYPEDPETELPDEGLSLHHCVGGYVDSQLTGATNILFLREKSCPNIPFITIEVNGGTIRQIHGSHNAWMGSSEETIKAIPFVLKWLVEKNIKCSRRILTSTSTSYGGGSSYIKLPKVDFDISNVIIE